MQNFKQTANNTDNIMGCAASSPLVVLSDQPDIHNDNNLNHLNVSTPPSSVQQPAAPPNTSVSNSSRQSSAVTHNGDDVISFGGLRGVLFRSTKSVHSNHHQALTTYLSDEVAPTKAPPTHPYNKDLHGAVEGPHSALSALAPSAFSSAHRVPVGGLEDASQFYSSEDPHLVPCPPSRDVIMAAGVSAPGSCSPRRSNGRRLSVVSSLSSAEENIALIGRGELPFGGSSSTSRRRGSTGSGTGRFPLPQFPGLPITPMPQQDAFQNGHRISENDNIDENVVPVPQDEETDEDDTPSVQSARRGETDDRFLSNHTNAVALPQLVMHPAFLVVEAKIFKPRNPLEPDSPISVHNSNANNFSGNPPRQGEEEQLCVPSQSAVPTCQQPQQRESELRPRAPSSQQSRVTMRPFFRTILVQEEARAAELAAAAHPSAPSPPPLSRASAMPSPPSSHQLMINQSFVPLTMVTSGSTLDQRQAQSLVSDEIGAASFASW